MSFPFDCIPRQLHFLSPLLIAVQERTASGSLRRLITITRMAFSASFLALWFASLFFFLLPCLDSLLLMEFTIDRFNSASAAIQLSLRSGRMLTFLTILLSCPTLSAPSPMPLRAPTLALRSSSSTMETTPASIACVPRRKLGRCLHPYT